MPAASATAARSQGRIEGLCSGASGSAGAGAGKADTGGAGESCGAAAAELPTDGIDAAAAAAGVDGAFAAGCGAGDAAAARWVSAGLRAGGAGARVSVAAALGRSAAVAGCGWVAGWSAGLVAVPGKLKFCSSRGPTVSGAGALVVAGGEVSCPCASPGASNSPAAAKTVFKRKIAFIAPALSL